MIVALGHQRCGAVAAACQIVEKNATFPGWIGPMAQAIVPAAHAVRAAAGDFVDNAVWESAKRSASRIETESSILEAVVKAGKVRVVAAHHDLDDGQVEFFC